VGIRSKIEVPLDVALTFWQFLIPEPFFCYSCLTPGQGDPVNNWIIAGYTEPHVISLNRERKHMIPKYEEIMLPFFKFLSDGNEHSLTPKQA
jgi:hypothetical protein